MLGIDADKPPTGRRYALESPGLIVEVGVGRCRRVRPCTYRNVDHSNLPCCPTIPEAVDDDALTVWAAESSTREGGSGGVSGRLELGIGMGPGDNRRYIKGVIPENLLHQTSPFADRDATR